MTLLDAPCFKEMVDTIRQSARGEPVAFISVPGNLGDALILQGALDLLEANDIGYEVVSSRRVLEFMRIFSPQKYLLHEFVGRSRMTFIRDYVRLPSVAKKSRVALICGGGAWGNIYSQGRSIAMTCTRFFDEVIVLPSTFETEVVEPPKGMTLFARDKTVSLQRAPGARFCHDTAFYLSPPMREPSRDVGWHFRTDAESSGRFALPADNRDISLLGDEHGDIDIMIDEVGKSASIVTDRLHVAIAATLLGRDVSLFSSSYFKIPEIYAASIQASYPRTKLLGTLNDLPPRFR
jgi:exopolysaccharide biosynthesis predicted pyruvyltransferase EpsI